MTTTPETVTAAGGRTSRGTDRADAARDHLWMHFARHGTLRRRRPDPDHRAR